MTDSPLLCRLTNRRIHVNLRNIIWQKWVGQANPSPPWRRHCLHWRRNEFESGGNGPARIFWGEGAQIRGKVPEKIWSCPSTFLAINIQVVVLVSAFVMVSFFFVVLLLTVPPTPCPAICKSGGTCLPCAMQSEPLPVPRVQEAFPLSARRFVSTLTTGHILSFLARKSYPGKCCPSSYFHPQFP